MSAPPHATTHRAIRMPASPSIPNEIKALISNVLIILAEIDVNNKMLANDPPPHWKLRSPAERKEKIRWESDGRAQKMNPSAALHWLIERRGTTKHWETTIKTLQEWQTNPDPLRKDDLRGTIEKLAQYDEANTAATLAAPLPTNTTTNPTSAKKRGRPKKATTNVISWLEHRAIKCTDKKLRAFAQAGSRELATLKPKDVSAVSPSLLERLLKGREIDWTANGTHWEGKLRPA
jgi:hypothetical protein